MIKQKRGEVFGMSFGMIFSIILIVFFIATAFIGIKYFLSYQCTLQGNLLVKDLQGDIDKAWNSEKTILTFNSSMPSCFDVDYICFIDFSKDPISASNIEINIYDNIKHSSYSADKILYFYNEDSMVVKSSTIKHLDLSKKNPVCFRVINDKVSIKIQKLEGNALVQATYQ
jgi:hypothetical protein